MSSKVESYICYWVKLRICVLELIGPECFIIECDEMSDSWFEFSLINEFIYLYSIVYLFGCFTTRKGQLMEKYISVEILKIESFKLSKSGGGKKVLSYIDIPTAAQQGARLKIMKNGNF